MKKILISSDCNGHFDLLLPKINSLHAKNKFDFMLMTGNVCPSTSSKLVCDLVEGKITAQLPIYFIDSSDMSGVLSSVYPEGHELAHNFHFLGKVGCKVISGVKVAYFNGIYSSALHEQVEYAGKFYSKSQYLRSIQQFQDSSPQILLTNQWPIQFEGEAMKNLAVSQISYNLSPRYHISASGTCHQRLPPFKSKKGHPTHFINVAPINNELPKDKYLVAIQLNPSENEQIEKINENPFIKKQIVFNQGEQKISEFLVEKSQKKHQKQEKSLTKNSYIYFQGFPHHTADSQITQFMEKWGQIKEIEVFKKLVGNKRSGIVKFREVKDAEICLKDSGKYTLYQNRIKFEIKQQNQKYRVQNCFLCPSNSSFDKSLIVHMGNLSYICVDKGPVSDYHFQIVPINHVASTRELSPEQIEEITSFKKILTESFNQAKYSLIFYERHMNLSYEINHCIIHGIPTLMPEQQVVRNMIQANMNSRYDLQQQSQKTNKYSEYYLKIEINSKNRFSKSINRKQRAFEIGRQIICETLRRPEKINWRDCILDEQKVKKSIEFLKRMLPN